MREFIREQLQNTLATLLMVKQNDQLLDGLAASARITADAMLKGNKLMVAGNGGSAADSQHLAAEFVGRFTIDRPALRAVALTTDSSCVTGIGNDYGYERVFERQIEALGRPGDVLLAISSSGNSPNLLCALERCRAMEITILGLIGGTGGKMVGLCDQEMIVPSLVTQNIQEAHLALEHIFCGLVERCYLEKRSGMPRSKLGGQAHELCLFKKHSNTHRHRLGWHKDRSRRDGLGGARALSRAHSNTTIRLRRVDSSGSVAGLLD